MKSQHPTPSANNSENVSKKEEYERQNMIYLGDLLTIERNSCNITLIYVAHLGLISIIFATIFCFGFSLQMEG